MKMISQLPKKPDCILISNQYKVIIKPVVSVLSFTILFSIVLCGCSRQKVNNQSLIGTWLSDEAGSVITVFYHDNTATIYEGKEHLILAQYQWSQSDYYAKDHLVYLTNNEETVAFEFLDGILVLPIRFKSDDMPDIINMHFYKDMDIPVEIGSEGIGL